MEGVFVQLNEASSKGRTHPVGYVLDGNGCWEWVGPRSDGYGRWRHGPDRLAHRIVYRRLVGDIPEGMALDHLCRNRSCVNPSHLEVVTNHTNIIRGEGPTAQNARRTHCRRGHHLTPDNLVVYKLRRGQRQCKVCHLAAQRRAWAKKYGGKPRKWLGDPLKPGDTSRPLLAPTLTKESHDA